MKKFLPCIIAVILICTMLLASCGKDKTNAASGDTLSEESAADSETAATANVSGMSFDFTDRDLSGDYSTSGAVLIELSGSGASVSGSGAAADGNSINITSAGTYIISGAGDNVMLNVTATDADKIQLVLNGASITNSGGPAIYIKSADKVFITLAPGSNNTIADSGSYSLTDGDTTLDAALFSRADLTINGSGTLNVNGACKHGIVSKDDLVIAGGTLNVTAQGVAVCGKDCIKSTGATLNLNAGSDGMRSDNSDDATRGYIYIESGAVTVTSGNDGIQAHTALKIDGGTVNITSGGGSANASATAGGKVNRGWGFGTQQSTASANEESAKGLKAGAELIISGGTFNINSADDSLHTNGACSITSGSFIISSGDDGIHADTSLSISGGEISIKKSYEGLESASISISGGNIALVASDDGLNAAGGNDSSALGGRPGQGSFSSSTGKISISGGYLLVNASGDGIDSNGSLEVSGGVTLVSGPTNSGNGAFDYDSSAVISGGVVIAAGSAGMAQNFTQAQNQGSMLCSFNSQSGGTSIAVCDKSGNVLAAFTAAKAYQCALISAPGIASSNTYTVVCGATVKGTDSNGFAQNTSLSGGTTVATVQMSSSIYGSGSGMGGGGSAMQPGGRK